LASLAEAADAPAENAPKTAPSPPGCFSSLWTYPNSSVNSRPLTYAGVTLYGSLDGGYGYQMHGVPGNPSADKVNFAISGNSNNTHWLWSPNALSASVIGLKMKEAIGAGWSLVGVLEAGFNPYSGMLINGPRSRTDNNVNALANQTANYDSSRAGQWDNSLSYIGLVNWKKDVWSNLDVAAGVYYRPHNDYLPAPGVCTGSGSTISSSECAGSEGAVSLLIDYRPIKRVDLYGVKRLGRLRVRPFVHPERRPDDRTAHLVLKDIESEQRRRRRSDRLRRRAVGFASVDADHYVGRLDDRVGFLALD
jgi:hypothetical protein